MTESIVLRDISLSWDCPLCGAKAARSGYMETLIRARCKPDCPKHRRPRRRNR